MSEEKVKVERVWVCDTCDRFGYDSDMHSGWCTAAKADGPYVPESSLARAEERIAQLEQELGEVQSVHPKNRPGAL